MLKNVLGIISLFLAFAGIADAAFYPDYYGMHKKYSINTWPWYSHHKIPGMKVHDYFDMDLSHYRNTLKSIQSLKPESIKPIALLKPSNYHQSLSNKPEINAVRLGNIPVSNKESKSIMTAANDASNSSSEYTRGETDSEQPVLDDSSNRNISSSKDSAVSPNITKESITQETTGSTPVQQVNSTDQDERHATDNQTAVSDTNLTSIPTTSSSENDSDSSEVNETSKLSTEEVTDYGSTLTGDEKTQTPEPEIDGQETRTETAITGDVTLSTLDGRTSEEYSTVKVKSTSLENEISLSTYSRKDVSESLFKSTGGSASSSIYTSPEPSISHRITDKITDRRYSVSNPKTGTLSSTEFPENNLLEQPEQVIEFQGIRTLKIVVSVVFMVIAFVAGTVLIVFIFKVKRQEVQYDQLTLIP